MKPRFAFQQLDFLDFDLSVCLCDEPGDTWRKERLGHTYHALLARDDFPEAMWCDRGRKGILIFKRSNLTHGIIAHECRHAVDTILSYREIKWGPGKCGETAGLAQENIARHVYRILRQWRTKIKT